MDSGRWAQIEALFQGAADLPPSEQPAYLHAASAGDQALIDEVLAMLAEDARGKSLLDRDLHDVAHAMLQGTTPSFSSTEFGPYSIQKVLGEGGMGVVYLAEREDIGSVVAIKLLRDAFLSPARRARFASEQRTLAQLEHPLIAPILDAGTLADGTPWFVMPYVEGVPITEYCRGHESTISERLRLIRAVCEAVQYAHSQAIIHRDLKPSNILVKADGTVRLLDFGIAKRLEGETPVDQTRTALRPMTLAYAAPEQIRGERLGTQTDVYSLGVVLYELLTGRLPFDFSNLSQGESEQIIVQREPTPPSAATKSMSSASGENEFILQAGKTAWSDLDVLCLTAMHKDTQRRYRSIEALTRDIDHYLKGEPLEAKPDSVRYRLGKFITRNRRALGATAAVCALMLAVIIFFVVRLSRARTLELAEATRTQRIERFMLNLFDGGDIAAGPADNLKVVTLIDRGARNAEALKAEPTVQAELYQTLGGIYQKLGKLDQADSLMHSALEQRKSLAGTDSGDVGNSLVALGLLRLDQGKTEEAERLAREGLAMNQHHLRANDPAVARAMFGLGHVLEERGNYDEAIKNLDEAVRLQSARGEITTDLSDSTNALATAQYYLGHFEAAGNLYKRALDMDTQLYGAVYPRVADDFYGLGIVQHDLGHDAQAEQYYRQALAIKQSWYGNEHPDTALIMAAVGQSLIYQKRYDEAAPLLQEAVGIQERIFGKSHPQVAQGLNILGVLELKRGHLQDAEAAFQRMADINRSAYGDRHYLVAIALMNLGQVNLEEKKYPAAAQFYSQALDRLTEKLPPGHPNTAITQNQLGHILVLEKRYKEAEPHLLAAYDVMTKQPTPPVARVQTARQDLVLVYEALQEPEKAQRYRAELAAHQAEDTSKTAKR
jgi:eukaryotic-like serine/threonine-protein kinase